MINFDSKGDIMPKEIITVTLSEFEETFCHNNRRRLIFEKYNSFIEKLKSLGFIHFYQYIDGSFVTTKHYPNRINRINETIKRYLSY
jgi:hypothetical protein